MKTLLLTLGSLGLTLLLIACENNSNVGGEDQVSSSSGFAITPGSDGLFAGDSSTSFTVIGGDEPMTWTLSDPALGMINETEGRTVTYTRDGDGAEGVNIISVVDAKGNRAQARVTQTSLLITPGSVVLADGTDTAAFTVEGGVEPFSWNLSDGSLGNLSSAQGRTVVYTREIIPAPITITDTNGVTTVSNQIRNVVNTIQVRDRRGATGSAVISHSVLQ